MKRYILIGLFFFSGLYASTLEVNEYQSDIYYGNGIMTTKKEAKITLYETLKPAILKKIYNDDKEKMNKYHQFKLSYNYSAKEKFGDTPIAYVLDLTEAYGQLTDTASGWKIVDIVLSWIVGKGSFISKYSTNYISRALQKQGLNKLIANYLAGKIKKEGTKFLEKLTAPWTYDGKHDKNVKEMVESYKLSLKAGHGVILVTHSQGNLFAVESVDKLDTWEKEYVHHVSIASPATRYASKSNRLISLDNDIVANILGSVGTNKRNVARYFTYDIEIEAPYNRRTSDFAESLRIKMSKMAPDGYWLDGYAPTFKVFVEEKDGVRYRVTATPDESEYMQINFHLFDFYMGNTVYPLHITENDVKNISLDGKGIYHSNTREAIVEAIGEAIEAHKVAKSQWRISKLLGCPGRCDAKVALKHVSDDSFFDFNPIVFAPSVLPFIPKEEVKRENYFGKLYKVQNKYVKSDKYAYTVEEVKTADVCQILVNEGREELARFEGAHYPISPDTIEGPIMVKLIWDKCYPAIDLDLDVRWNTGYLDVHDDKNASFEHFVIEREEYVLPREAPYEVYVTDKTDRSLIDPSLISKNANPIDISVMAVTPTDTQIFKTQVTSLYQLDLGHVLDIEVKKKLKIVYPTRDYNHVLGDSVDSNVGGAYAGSYAGGAFSCGSIPCTYKITNYLKNAMLGPISGGAVEIKRISTDSIVYKGMTTKGEDIVTTGVIDIPTEISETFVEDEIYLINVEGGEDIDSDDDFYVDTHPTVNNGTLHAIVTGKQLRYLNFKVNILTEIAYQVSKDKISGNSEQLKIHLDAIAKKIFSHKVFIADTSSALNYLDILTWVPTLDKNNLKKDYDIHVEPIVQKVYANEDRLQYAYDFVYQRVNIDAPELNTLTTTISEYLPEGAVIGTIDIIGHGDSDIVGMTLTGVGSDNFLVNKDGIVTVSHDANISEQLFYSLSAIAVNENNHTSVPVYIVLQVIQNPSILVPNGSVPYVVNIEKIAIDENSVEGIVVAQISFADTNNSIVSMQIEGGSSQFKISLDGTLSVKADADINYEKTQSIGLDISATNSIGNTSLPTRVNITINNVIDTPAYKLFFMTHIKENLAANSIIGYVERVRDGSSEISSIDILNSDVPFSIDTNGTIRLNGTIDYETKDEYNLVAIARSGSGDSNRISLNIYIDDVLEVGMPSLEDFNIAVDENISNGTQIGTLSFEEGESPIDAMTLSGVGSSNFSIDTNGTLFISQDADIDYEKFESYKLKVIAINSNGSSNTAIIRIDINDIDDKVFELWTFTGSIPENTSTVTIIGKISIATPGDGNISDYTLTGRGSENFSIDENGTIRVSSFANLDYETTARYDLQTTVISDGGESEATSVFIYILNISEHIPILKPFTGSVQENASIGTAVGQIDDIGGDSPIISYSIDDNSSFNIDENGTVRVTAALDYEVKKIYILEVTATNVVGESSPEPMTINIANIIDDEAVLNDVTLTVSEDSNISTIVGVVDVNSTGTSAITNMRLEGIGAEKFSIDVNGTVTLEQNLDYEIKKVYNLRAIATNTKADSPEANITIEVINIAENLPELNVFKGFVEDNATAGTRVGNITFVTRGDSLVNGFVLSGDGHENFSIDLNGTVRVSDIAFLDENIKKTYTLTVSANNMLGSSATVDATIILTTDKTMVNQISNLELLEIGTTSLTIGWTDDSENERGFNLYVNEVVHATLDRNITGYTLTGLEEGTTYMLTIKSFNDRGESAGASISGITDIDTSEYFKAILVQKCGVSASTFEANFNRDTGHYSKSIYCVSRGLTDEDLLNFKDLKSIDGYLKLNNNNLTNVDGLSGLKTVGGDLFLYGNELENIDGLNNLTSVSGSFYVKSNKITNLDALSNLINVGGQVSFMDNPNLVNISGIQNVIGSYGKFLWIDSGQYTTKADKNSSLCASKWDLFDMNGSIDDDMSEVCEGQEVYVVSDTEKLRDVLSEKCRVSRSSFNYSFNITTGHYDGSLDCTFSHLTDEDLLTFKALKSVQYYLQLYGNNLTNLAGLSNLSFVGGDFDIENNQLINVDGLRKLVTVGGYVSLYNNTNLTDISGAGNIQGSATKFFYIDADQYTVRADVNSSMCSSVWDLREPSRDMADDMNHVCEGQEPFVISDKEKLKLVFGNKCGISTISFNYKFNIETGHYSSSIYCSSSGLTDEDLLTFNVLKSVKYGLYLDNNNFTNLDGLSNLRSVGSKFYLDDNKLTNVDGLNNLTSVGGDFNLERNELIQVNGLTLLTNVGGYVALRSNPSLTDISGIENIVGSDGKVLYITPNQYTIKANNSLNFCSSTWDLKDINGDIEDDMSLVCEIEIVPTEIQQLMSVLDLKCSVTSSEFVTHYDESTGVYDTSLDCSYQEMIDEDLAKFTILNEIQGSFSINDNNLTTVEGLVNLKTIGGYFFMENNHIEDISGLSNLRSVNGILNFSANLMPDLDGFSSLTTVQGAVEMYNNPNLVDISGLTSLTGFDGKKIYIDTTDYTVKADSTGSFCANRWDIYDTTGNIADDMSKLCEGYTYLKNSMDLLRNMLGSHCNIDSSSFYTKFVEASGLYNGDINCTSLQDADMDNFEALLEVSGDFRIEDNNITTLDALIHLKSVSKTLSIQGNANLTDIDGLSNVLGVDGQKLIIDAIDQYDVKADSTLDFCLTGWDVYTGDVNVVDDMSAVCNP